jgi:hypothetical protein
MLSGVKLNAFMLSVVGELEIIWLRALVVLTNLIGRIFVVMLSVIVLSGIAPLEIVIVNWN